MQHCSQSTVQLELLPINRLIDYFSVFFDNRLFLTIIGSLKTKTTAAQYFTLFIYIIIYCMHIVIADCTLLSLDVWYFGFLIFYYVYIFIILYNLINFISRGKTINRLLIDCWQRLIDYAYQPMGAALKIAHITLIIQLCILY